MRFPHGSQPVRFSSKNGLKLIRTDLQEASYPTVVTRMSSKIVGQDSHGLSYKDGGPFAIDNTSSGDYLRFYMSKPCKKVYPDGDDRNSNGYVAECTVSFDGRRLVYNRSIGAVDDPASDGIDSNDIIPITDKVLIEDVSEFNIEVGSAASAEYNMNFCTITVTCFHPSPKLNTNVTERTGTKLEVAADPGL